MNRSPFSWQRALALAASAVALSLVAACGGGAGTQSSQSSNQPLQFFLSGDANQGGGFAHMAQKYKQEKGVDVQIVDIANADLPTKLKSAAQANALPALARVGAVDPVWKDLTVDLKPVTDGSRIMMKLSAVEPGGKVLSIPTDVTAVGMFVNKTLFDKAGVKYPTSEDDVWNPSSPRAPTTGCRSSRQAEPRWKSPPIGTTFSSALIRLWTWAALVAW